jgi:predicted GIY-YIG superfamily endonuclease
MEIQTLIEITSKNTLLNGLIETHLSKFLEIRIFSHDVDLKDGFCKKPLFKAIDVYRLLIKRCNNETRFYKQFTDNDIVSDIIYIKKINGVYTHPKKIKLFTLNGLVKISIIGNNIQLRELVYSMIRHISDYSAEDLNNHIIQPTIEKLNTVEIQNELKQVQELENTVVYFINEENSDKIKIGYTTDLNSRLSTLQRGNSSKLIVLKTHECKTSKEAIDVEQLYHKIYANNHIRGEWFNIPNFL